MHAMRLLHKTLEESAAVNHAKRLDSLLAPVQSLCTHGKLSLTSIGRHMPGPAKVKHKIKAVDYLLSNGALHAERLGIYQALSKILIGGLSEIDVIVDWSPCVHHDNQILKASVVLSGRSLTLYEEVHPEKSLGNYGVHQAFLKRLNQIIPDECRVMILTDAGFRTEWFNLVLKQGWDYTGRIRSNMLFQHVEGDGEWKSCLKEYEYATGKPAYRGEVFLSKENKLKTYVYLYKEPRKNRNAVKKKKKPNTKDKIYTKSAHDPWLLVSSRAAKEKPVQIINSYRKRMKIEHEFRDTKDPQWGIGMRYTRTYDPKRLQILLLLGNLAIFLLWLIGLATENQKLQYQYQANTIKDHRVISLVFLGLQVIFHDTSHLSIKTLKEALVLGRKG